MARPRCLWTHFWTICKEVPACAPLKTVQTCYPAQVLNHGKVRCQIGNLRLCCTAQPASQENWWQSIWPRPTRTSPGPLQGAVSKSWTRSGKVLISRSCRRSLPTALTPPHSLPWPSKRMRSSAPWDPMRSTVHLYSRPARPRVRTTATSLARLSGWLRSMSESIRSLKPVVQD